MIELPPAPDGKRVRKKRRAKTKTEATAILRQLRIELMQHSGVGDAQRLVEATMADYLRLRDADELADKTRELDRWMAGLIVAGLGPKRAGSLTVADCDNFFAGVSTGRFSAYGKPVGRTHLRRVRSCLVRALRNDLRLGLITRNVAELSVLPVPSTEVGEKRSLTVGELDRLCRAADGATSVLIDLSGRNGLRPAEARALRWANVDFSDCVLTVDSQMSAENKITSPKTKRARRSIRVDDRTAELLAKWSVRQAKQRDVAGVAWEHLDLVAATASGRSVLRSNFRRSLEGLSKRLGIDPAITPYELRHTAITLQAEAGHLAWQIADWAGTSERMITEVYRHKLTAVASLGPVELTPE